jgi:hypothetical protein
MRATCFGIRRAAVWNKTDVIPSVIACGIFAHRRADTTLGGMADGSVLTVVPG